MKLISFDFNKSYYSDFRVFFFHNSLQVSGKWGNLRRHLPFFLVGNNVFFIEHCFLRVFFSILRDLIIGVTCRWFVELEMKGLGFKTFYSFNEGLYKIDLGYNHYIFYPLQTFFSGGVKTKRRSKFIVVYGIDKLEVFKVVNNILAFRPMTSYKFRGIKFKDQLLKLKIGKKKQFF